MKCGIGCGKSYVLYVGGVLGRLEYLLCGPALLAAFDCEEQCIYLYSFISFVIFVNRQSR